jgi:1-acyl-sn-glycerol-3-phosphate acyltransferase
MMIRIRSALFNLAFYGWTAVLLVALWWLLLAPRSWMMGAVRWYLGTLGFLERNLAGIDYVMTGREHLPDPPYIVAAKHQSAWETFKLHRLFDEPAVVMKRELMQIPIWGWFAARAGMVPIDRAGRGAALHRILSHARKRAAERRPIVIFPQGTRVAPGDYKPYQVGAYALYSALKLPVVPMAVNSGLFWPRKAFLKRPGTIRVELLAPIPPGLGRHEFLERLESRLEGASERLVVEAGGPPTPRPDRPRRRRTAPYAHDAHDAHDAPDAKDGGARRREEKKGEAAAR